MNKKLKRLTIFLASAACCAAFGLSSAGLFDADAATYSPSSIFTRNGGVSVAADATDATKLAFKFTGNDDKVAFNRDLAWKWREAAGSDGLKYLNFEFALPDEKYKDFTVTLETASLTATEKDKVTNKIVFTRLADKLCANLNGVKGGEVVVGMASEDVKVSVSEDGVAEAGDYKVLVNAVEIGTIKNVGSDYAGYVSGEDGREPLSFQATLNDDAKDVLCIFKSLNGQSFALNANKDIEDTAAPVLVIDDDTYVPAMGEAFSLESKVIDVLDKSSSVKSTVEYYQWSPVSEKAEYKAMSSFGILDVPYKKADGTVSTVYDDEGREYISVKYTLTDSSHTKDAKEEEKKAAVVYAEWYLQGVYDKTLQDAASTVMPLLAVEEDKTAPDYVGGLLDEAEDNFAKKYLQQVIDKAADLEAGSGESFYLPSPEKLFEDNSTGYKSLKYTLCYKTRNGTPSNTSNVSMSSLKLSLETTGVYEFKLYVTDRAGNVMKSLKPGDSEAEKLTTENIWDHDELPTFSFTITNQKKIYIDDGSKSSRSDTGLIGVKYSDISFTVKGGTAGKSEYGLYYFDLAYFNELYSGQFKLSVSDLSSVTSSDLGTSTNVEQAAEKYAAAIAQKLDPTMAKLKAEDLLKTSENGRAVLRKIDEYREKVSEDNAPCNKYEWNATNKSFIPVESGDYIVLGVFKDNDLLGSYATAYKAISVTDKEDVNPGESEWLKNNIISVVLFSIAGVMLILIIVLLFVKPSDETLEDVGEEKKGKKTAKK